MNMPLHRNRLLPRLLLSFLLLPAAACNSGAVTVAAAPAPIEPLIEARVAVLATGETLRLQGVDLAEVATLREFYTRRGFVPAWQQPAQVDALLRAIRASALEGLNPADYHLDAILALQAASGAARGNVFVRADAELVYSDALAKLARHYAFGKVEPASHEPTWNIRAPDADRDAAAVLARLVDGDLERQLAAELPTHPIYHSLREQLLRYRLIAARGGWPQLPAGETLKPGMDDARVPLLRQRLAASGDYSGAADATLYDDALLAGVARFQARHGLKPDGAVGKDTLEQLNTPVAARIDTLRINLDRGRVLLRGLPPRFVVVNIAGYRIYLIEDGNIAWQSRVVVGQRYRETPLFRSEINYLQWNPSWTVPPGIIQKDILPEARRDPAAITRRDLKVLGRDGREVDPASIDWSAYRSGHIPWTLRQDPGPKNALGRVKFMFPNDYHVYLHDTPSKRLFDADDRTFSSGCVRVEDPLTLARLLINDPAWDDARIARVIESGRTENLVLKKRVPVLLAYWTAWVDEQGTLQLRKDVYGRDARWLAALDATP